MDSDDMIAVAAVELADSNRGTIVIGYGAGGDPTEADAIARFVDTRDRADPVDDEAPADADEDAER